VSAPLIDVLRSLTEARFEEVVAKAEATGHVTRAAPPLTRTRELHAWAKETVAQEERLRRVLAAELAAWPTAVLPRWLAWSTARLGEIPILGFQGTMRAPVDLNEAFVPLALEVRHLPGEGRALKGGRRGVGDHEGPDGLEFEEPERWVGWTLKRAVADAEASDGRCRGLAIVGLPGSGKTTLLKHAWGVVADRGADDLGYADKRLQPVFVRMGACDPADPAHELLPRALRRSLGEHGYEAAADELLRGPVVWMLDGLDEAGVLDRRKRLADRLGKAFGHRADDRYLLTSRTAGWRDVEGLLAGRLRGWNVQPLRREDVEPFIHRWYQAVEPVLAGTGRTKDELCAAATKASTELASRLLSSAWMADSRRERMALNPLMLSVLCLVHRQRGRGLPEKRHLLYEAALDVMFEQLPEVDPFDGAAGARRHEGLPKEEGLRLLAAVAWGAHCAWAGDDDVAVFTTEDAARWMEPVLDRFPWSEGDTPVADLLRRAEEDCGVLVSPSKGTWQFAHLTFQEYLAACHADAEGLGAQLAAWSGEDRWEEPIRLAMRFPRLGLDLLRAVLADPAAPWERARFETLMRDCAREADPTPYAEALDRCHLVLEATRGGAPESWAVQLAGRVMMLFEGRAPPARLEKAARRFVELSQAPTVARAARALLAGELVRGALDAVEPGDVRALVLPGGQRLLVVWVPGGEFWMGASKVPGAQNHDPGAYDDEAPVRRVRLTEGCWMGVHPVTNAQYRAFTAAAGHRPSEAWSREGRDGDEQPVTRVDWDDASAFCAWVSRALGERVALPTEAQWERAARGDDARKYPWGDAPPTPAHAVFDRAPLAAVGGRLAGVGPYGTHDQVGNVWEWCRDGYGPYPNVSGVDIDPCREVTSPDVAPRVVRGGSWGSLAAWLLRAARRDGSDPNDRGDGLGFRVCVLPEPGR
jgi:formylglycine-generating enzyme required for sulfatase activity